MKLSDVAAAVDGALHGDGNTEVDNLAMPDTAVAGSLLFAFDERAAEVLQPGCGAAAVIREGSTCALPYVSVHDVRAAQVALLHLFALPRAAPTGIHPSAVVDPSAVIGADTSIGPLVCIGADAVLGNRVTVRAGTVVGAGCRIGDDTVLEANVTLYDGVSVGARCTLHSGAVIGANGFGYQFSDGRHQPIPQLGTVILEDEVDVGANTTIDRATLGATRVGAGTKIDNLVMMGHNVRTGQGCLIISQVGIAGSTTLGNGVVLAGQVGVADHLHLGDGTMVGAQAGVAKDSPPGARLLGTPALPGLEFHRMMAALSRLPDIIRELRQAQREASAAAERLNAQADAEAAGEPEVGA